MMDMVSMGGGKTYRFPGTMQYPMTVEQQQIAHLIAVVNRSIHPYEPSF